MSPTDRPTKAQRREEARQEALRIRQEQEKAARRRRTIAIAAAGAILLGFAVLVAVILSQGGDDDVPEAERIQPSFGSDSRAGIVLDADGIVTPPEDAGDDWPVGAFGDDVVVVTVYSDPICPACGLFAATAGPVLEEMRQAGEIVVDHRIVGNLDVYSQGSRYSTRAAQALYTVAEEAPESYLAFEEALFAQQPAEGTTGLTDEEIADIAREAGVPEAAVTAIGEGRFTWWVGEVTDAARDRYDGRLLTPTVLLNGSELAGDVDWRDEAALRRSIEEARG